MRNISNGIGAQNLLGTEVCALPLCWYNRQRCSYRQRQPTPTTTRLKTSTFLASLYFAEKIHRTFLWHKMEDRLLNLRSLVSECFGKSYPGALIYTTTLRAVNKDLSNTANLESLQLMSQLLLFQTLFLLLLQQQLLLLLLLLLLSIRGMGVVWGYPGFLQRPATGKHFVIEPRVAIQQL